MLVFKYSDIVAHKSDFLMLMASDNTDSAISLADDELSVAARLSIEADIPRVVQPGKTLEEMQIRAVQMRSATQLVHEDFVSLLSWPGPTQTTTTPRLPPIVSVRFVKSPAQSLPCPLHSPLCKGPTLKPYSGPYIKFYRAPIRQEMSAGILPTGNCTRKNEFSEVGLDILESS